MKFVIVKIQRPGRLMCQNSYMSMEMCFQNISQRMLLQKLYNYAIDFMEGTKLPKPAKVYLLFLAERNSLDT